MSPSKTKFLLKKVIKKLLTIRSLKYYAPWSPYRRMSVHDRRDFERVLAAWKPDREPPVILLRWLVTEWCNYNCGYCDQTHDRYAAKNGYTAHAFDNVTLEKWLKAFAHHFRDKRLSLVITGGEPMIDRNNTVQFLRELSAMPTVECIRIDTNASWDPDAFEKIDLSKIILMCTYHPGQVSKERFMGRIDRLLDAGFKVGMVNYVMNKENFPMYERVKKQLATRGIPLHPNPLWDAKGQYSAEDLSLLKEELPELDYMYRTRIASPHQRRCLFPALGYEMDQIGNIHVGCHSGVSGNFFNNKLPGLFAGAVPCPHHSCVCLDKYSFLKNVDRNLTPNPLRDYSDELFKRK